MLWRLRGSSCLGWMIEVASIAYGCHWDETGHVVGWPLQIRFGAVGPETTVDQMLEGRGHTVMMQEQLVRLVAEMTSQEMPVELQQPVPMGLASRLIKAGFRVTLC